MKVNTPQARASGMDVELRWASFLIGLAWDTESDADFSIYLGPLSLTWPVEHGLPADRGQDWYVGRVAGWNIYLCIDTNIWVVGVSWSPRDIGIYAGPINVQLEKHSRR
jgi:hypothetical protein